MQNIVIRQTQAQRANTSSTRFTFLPDAIAQTLLSPSNEYNPTTSHPIQRLELTRRKDLMDAWEFSALPKSHAATFSF
jgi:hypothetical protein